jgi:hypothetical protein
MKKSKLLIASMVISFALTSASTIAGPGVKKPPQAAKVVASSFSPLALSGFAR